MSSGETLVPPARHDAVRALAPLFAASAFAWLAMAIAPHVAPPDVLVDPLAVLVAVVPAVAALALSSRTPLSGRVAGSLGVSAAALLVALYFVGLRAELVALQVLALLALGRGVGALIGDRVQHPGHMLPACVVAATADVASVLSPEGVSNAIVGDPRALSVAALAAPVFGTNAITFVLGVGDLVIIGLLLAVAAKFQIATLRVALALAVGLALAFVASALTARPIPALVTIGLAAMIGVPRFARLEPRDRRAAVVAFVVCAGLLAFVALR